MLLSIKFRIFFCFIDFHCNLNTIYPNCESSSFMSIDKQKHTYKVNRRKICFDDDERKYILD